MLGTQSDCISKNNGSEAVSDMDFKIYEEDKSMTQKPFINLNGVDSEKLKVMNDELKEEDTFETDGDYDAYGDDKQVHRKYRLRKTNETQNKMKLCLPEVDCEDALFPCFKCPKRFNSKTGLLNHMRMHQTEKKYTCALCSLNFANNILLKKHKAVHIQEKRTFFCTVCKMAFTDHCDFLLHGLSHTKQTLFKCIECNTYYKKNNYKSHITVHYDKTKLCPVCNMNVREISFTSHVNNHKNVIKCVECGKVCGTKSYYSYHILSHTGVRPFQCLYCGKGFCNNGQRNIHTRIHTDEKPYECDTCQEKFRQYTDMKRHKQSNHSKNSKNYQCDFCRKEFIHKNSLRCHIRKHMKDNLYYCSECNAGFHTASSLKVHMLGKHTKERPIRCEACNMGFVNNNKFQVHARSKKHKRNAYGLSLKKEQQNGTSDAES